MPSVPVDPPLHDEAEALLPWYATGQIEPADRLKVERHLYDCDACRRQLKVERRLASQVQAMSPQVDAGWARLHQRIEDTGRPRSSRLASFWIDLGNVFKRPVVAALVAAQLTFVLVAGAVLFSLTRPEYHALGSATAPPAANAIVIFDPAASEARMRQSLNAADASIVGGPTVAGAYLVHVDGRERSVALAALKRSGAAQLAEPIDGTAAQ